MYSLIWREGVGAHNRGVSRHENPYQNCQDNSGLAWERGWDKAHQVKKAMEKVVVPDCEETTILENYRVELESALKWKLAGKTHVSDTTAGPKLSAGRLEVPIDEYIKMWQDGVTAMEAGADQEQFNY